MYPQRKYRFLSGPGLIVSVTMLLASCTQDAEVGRPAAPDPYPPATTPTILLENFVRAYASRDLEAYADLLHEAFVFSFQACDVQRLGLSKSHFTREDELQTAANMFAGEDLVKNDGQLVRGITDILFLVCEQEEPWAPAGDAAAVPDAVRASYQVLVRFRRTDGSTLRVRGRTVFFAAPVVRAVASGGAATQWQLVGWVDLTEGCGS